MAISAKTDSREQLIGPKIDEIIRHYPTKSYSLGSDSTDLADARFHILVDRSFLGALTDAETEELEILTERRDAGKNDFYRQFIPEAESGNTK